MSARSAKNKSSWICRAPVQFPLLRSTPIKAPLGLRDKVGLEQTNLVSRMFERWGEVPIGLLQKTDWRASLYGYIGLEDYTLSAHSSWLTGADRCPSDQDQTERLAESDLAPGRCAAASDLV